jgi:hypothetical protein
MRISLIRRRGAAKSRIEENLTTKDGSTMTPDGLVAQPSVSALTGFEAALRLVDDVNATLAPDQTVIPVPTAQRFQ